MRSINRRDFLHDSAILTALAGAGLGSESLAAETNAAKKNQVNDQLRVAVVGVHGRGREHIHGFAGKNNCIVTTICDVDSAVIGKAMKDAETQQKKMPRYEQDIRKVVEDKDIDIISIATPNHWHALAAIWAMQNGKDVYVEKPVSHNVSEGRRIVEVARKTNRICQAGTQSRSSKGMREAMAFLHSGKLGKIRLARGLCYKLRPSIGKVDGPQSPPKTMNYDLWCGPAPLKPPHRKTHFGTVHYDWHWIWDYGNGDLGNQGIHEMDKARWGLNKHELATGIVSVGGRLGYIDDGETPNTMICVYDYGDCELIFEVRGWPSKSPFPGKKSPKDSIKPTNFVGNIFYGSEGFMVCPSYSNAVAYSNDGEVIKEFKGGDDHFANFVKAVRSRKVEDLNADILEGHLSSALCHLGNISYRLGDEQPFGQQPQAFAKDKDAGETFERMEQHLKDNKIDLGAIKCRIGRKLVVDPAHENFPHDSDANAMLTREYRKGFEVPAKV
ncbi:MAG TPA: Gfo/Idh/MocA family oxidoreductase [Gemmataceae bacterium]|nr:Gfo/Idh/MocA family oxidoreductase [Gemmataceae bacterium]